jgi:hypothetical protein
MSRLVHVTVALYIQDDCDIDAVIEGLDYSFDHPAIIDQELIDYEERRQRYPKTIGQMTLNLD